MYGVLVFRFIELQELWLHFLTVGLAIITEYRYRAIHLSTLKLLLLLKKVGSARLRESDVHPISPKTLAPQYQPIDRNKRKGKE